jgi:chemotaxis protein methyltransferase WspC
MIHEQTAFHQIIQLLQRTIGLAPNCLSDRALMQVIQQRQTACGLTSLVTYWLHLQGSATELTQLIEAIVVSETWFFRDYQPFVYLTQFALNSFSQNRSQRLRILSLPCATGEEPYSIAIALLEAGIPAQRFQIDAIDISQIALEKARQAIYDQNSFREKRFTERDRYFSRTPSGRYQLHSLIQFHVKFRQTNLLDPNAFVSSSIYDVIFCRNLLIYLDLAARNQAIATLKQLLTPTGILFVGHSELNLLTAPHWKRVRSPFTFAVHRTPPPTVSSSSPVSSLAPKPTPKPTISPNVPPDSSLTQARQSADQGQLHSAIAQCQSYLTQFPTDPEAYVLLGTIQQAIGQDTEADRSFQHALYLDPNHEDALIHLALLKEQTGDRAAAATLRQRLQRL